MTIRAVLLTPFFRPIVGGVESNAERLARYFAADGIEVIVLTKRLTQDLPDAETRDGFQIVRIGPLGPRSPAAKWLMLPHVTRWLVANRAQYDVVCSIDCRGVGLGALVARLRTSKAVIAQPQTTGVLIPDAAGGGIHRRALIRILGQLYARADAIACIARTIEREALAAGVPRPRVHFLPNAIDMTRFSPPSPAQRIEARRRIGLDDGDVVCVFVGRLSREKGLMDLLDAWRIVSLSSTPLPSRLVIAGPDMDGHAWNVGPESRAFVTQHGLTESVIFAGATDDVPGLMRAADVAVQPSHFEALGLSAIEALACGVPVLASAVGGLVDFVADGSNGLLFPPHNPNALAARLDAVMADGALRRRLAANARRSVESEYDERVVFARFATLARQLAAGRG